MNGNERPQLHIPYGDEAQDGDLLRVPDFDHEPPPSTNAGPSASRNAYAPTGPSDRGIDLRPKMSGYRGFGKRLWYVAGAVAAVVAFGFLFGFGAFRSPSSPAPGSLSSEVTTSPIPAASSPIDLASQGNGVPVNDGHVPIARGNAQSNPQANGYQPQSAPGAGGQGYNPQAAQRQGQALQMGAGQYGEYSAPNVNPQTGVPDPTASVIPQSYTPPNTTPNAAGINAAAIVQQAIQSEQQAAGSPMIVSGTTSSVTETAAASQKIGGLAPGETASANTQSYWLWEGDEIPAQLDTKIVSDLCRVVVAHVTKPGVFDSKTGSHLLIPAFSRITGQCSGTPQQGASREGIDWKTITLPNGNTIDVSGLSASDTSGATGLSAQVDAHSVSTFRQTLLQSIFQRLASIGQNESVVVNAGTTAVPQQAVIPPTLTVPAGTPLTIIVDRRLQIKEYDGDRGSP